MSLRAEGLTRTFGEVRAVDGLSLSVGQGEIFGLVGPDGAGKTTTLRLLASVLLPTAGDAWVNDRHVVLEAEAVKESIGYMSQRFGLYADLTVLENILFYADLYGVPQRERKERIESLLGFSNLTPFQKRFAGNLSGGMKQKLGLACALVHTPKVLLLDEPTSGVDPVSRRDFWRILHRLLGEGVTILVATSYMDEAERCSRVGLLESGKLLTVGTPRELKGQFTDALLEIRPERARPAARILRPAFPEGAVQLFGDRLHVRIVDAAAAETRVLALLSEAGMGSPPIRRLEPTLEDVYLSLLSSKAEP